VDQYAALVIGVYLIAYGLVARTLINESEIAATEDERSHARATPLKRVLVVGTGVACCIYSAVLFTR
jgi:hypothetical protein